MRLILSFLLFLGVCAQSWSQTGGTGTYEFLNLPVSARSAAMGGSLISASESDINLAADNPASIDSSLDKHATLTYVNYVSDINFGYVGYARKLSKFKGTFNAGLQFVNYGQFAEADFSGNELGTFSAGEYAARVDYGHPIDSLFRVGGSFKVIYSSLYVVKSMGVAVDLGGSYISKNKRFSAGLVMRNAGVQIDPYVEGNREPLGFEINGAISKRFANAPIRVTLMATHLTKWDLTYPEAEADDEELAEEIPTFTVDKLLRHGVIGVEFLPSDNFHLRLGYNFKRRQELKIANRPGLAGFSFGAEVKIKKFRLGYSLARYHLGGASNHLTISSNLSEWRTRG